MEPYAVTGGRGSCRDRDRLGEDAASAFKLMPGRDRYYVPCSEHLHDTLQLLLDEMLFLGSDYERAFDRFEVLYALEYAHLEDGDGRLSAGLDVSTVNPTT